MALSTLAADLGAVLHGDGTVAPSSITQDSREVQPGTLFCCVPGASFDGHDFAEGAVAGGAVALLCQRKLEIAVPQLVVPSVRDAMGGAACAVFGDPSARLNVVGVTGTNGKTTVVHLLATILARLDAPVEVRGTLTGARTTPEAPEVQAALADAARRGIQTYAMEVSSHALDLGRVNGTRFGVAVFTNLGRDHLDHHGTEAAYYEAKASLFRSDRADLAVINTDDPAGQRLAMETDVPVVGYGLADAEDLEFVGAVSHFRWRDLPVVLQLAGAHNVQNALAAAITAEALGFEPVDIVDGLCAAEPARGRFEFVDVGQPFRLAVDYAHTPDALEAALAAARNVAPSGRVHVVFGCGGNRDRDKRPQMGAAAKAGADQVIVTSDNPRDEDPLTIIGAILDGIPGAPDNEAVVVEPDRAAAIGIAVSGAQPGDLVLVAGKGHETTQVVGDTVIEFDDRAVAIAAIIKIGGQS